MWTIIGKPKQWGHTKRQKVDVRRTPVSYICISFGSFRKACMYVCCAPAKCKSMPQRSAPGREDKYAQLLLVLSRWCIDLMETSF